jgi:hypothetical protein
LCGGKGERSERCSVPMPGSYASIQKYRKPASVLR